MSWERALYNVYENNYGREDIPKQDRILPVAHSTANAQVEIVIDEAGNFISARRLEDKSEIVTIIPVTESSAGARTSGVTPHPFADKLVYIAGDYRNYATGKKAENSAFHHAYMEQLKSWKDSPFHHPAVDAVYTYLEKATLMKDLVKSNVLITDETSGKLKGKEKIQVVDQEDAFVRFVVDYKDESKEKETWMDQTLYDSFISYNNTQLGEEQLCYATGSMLPVTYKHPAKIRNAGDKAKLISTNDESGFTYRGRFDNKFQAISVSYDFSQKMHNALKWLVARQGVTIGSFVLLAWDDSMQPLPNILGNIDLYHEEDPDKEVTDNADVAETMETYQEQLKRAIWGEKSSLDINPNAMVMGLDAATTGRLSISMYEEMPRSELLEHIEQWHADTAWRRFIPKKKQNGIQPFSLYEIIDCAFGTEQGDFIKCKDEIKNYTICRLIPCVTKGRRLPTDIVRNLVIKASNPQAYGKEYNWRKVLECACGMIKRTILEDQRVKIKEDNLMAIDYTCTERDYLYGRLLAIEASTYEKGKERTTNARRYFEAFANHPYRTWAILCNRLTPYLNKMPEKTRRYFMAMMNEVQDKFTVESFKDNKKLKPIYLLGYHNQLEAIYKRKPENTEDTSNTDDK